MGDFAEVEALAGGDDLAEAQAAVLGLARELGLDRVEPRSYLRMILERDGRMLRGPHGSVSGSRPDELRCRTPGPKSAGQS